MKSKKIKTVLVQRICPHYRVPVFRRLAEQVDLILFYGRGMKSGAQQNAGRITGFKSARLPTLAGSLQRGERDYYLSWFPTLIYRIWKEKPDVIIVGGATDLPNNLMVIPFGRLAGIPVIWWDAGRDIGVAPGGFRRAVEPIIRRLIAGSCACIAYGESGRKYFSSLGVDDSRIFIAENTMDISEIDRNRESYADHFLTAKKERLNVSGKKIILYVGALERRKKIENLLRAFKLIRNDIPPAGLLIVGDGSRREELERTAETLGLTDVLFLGRIIEEVGLYFLMADLFVQPGWSSLALVEAMAYGTPVITVPFGGPEFEVVEENRTGMIVEKDDISILAEAIKKLITDHSLREEMGRAARREIQSRGLTSMVSEMVAAITFCAGKRKNKKRHR